MLVSMQPRVIERECGGSLAVTTPEDSLRIAVTAPSRGEVETAFGMAVEAWEALLAKADSRARGVETTEN